MKKGYYIVKFRYRSDPPLFLILFRYGFSENKMEFWEDESCSWIVPLYLDFPKPEYEFVDENIEEAVEFLNNVAKTTCIPHKGMRQNAYNESLM